MRKPTGLLDRAAVGEKIVIERQDKPAAIFSAAPSSPPPYLEQWDRPLSKALVTPDSDIARYSVAVLWK